MQTTSDTINHSSQESPPRRKLPDQQKFGVAPLSVVDVAAARPRFDAWAAPLAKAGAGAT